MQFCDLTNGLSSPTSLFISTQVPPSRKSFLGDTGSGMLFQILPLRSDYSRDPFASCSLVSLLLQTAVLTYRWEQSPSNCSPWRQEATPQPQAEWGSRRYPARVWGVLCLPKITYFPASSRKAPKSLPLFLGAGQGDSAIQGQGAISAGRASIQ